MKIKANGIWINYELLGKEEAPVVVLSHSLGSSLAMWDTQMEALEAHYLVLRYDTRGHGDSDAPEGAYTLDQLGEDAIGLLDVLGIDVVHWTGLSMGGMIGQYIALNHAERLRSLALCDTAAIIPEDAQPVWQERIDAARDKGRIPGSRLAVLPSAAHLSNIEQAEAFNSILMGFFEKSQMM